MTNQQANIQPLVSFIVTDYNLPIQLLRECIESIIALNIKPDEREIILVDDGSASSPESDLADLMPFVKYIRQENQGLSAARNFGIEKSKGRFIQFVDGDDCLLENYNECVSSIRENDFDMLFFDRVTQKTASFPGKTSRLGKGIDYMLSQNICGSAWCYVFKRELLGDNLRFTKGILHEDEEFTPLLILRAKNVARYSGSAYYYRVREDSIIHLEDKAHFNRRINDFIGVIIRLKETASQLEGDGKKALCRRINQLTMDIVYNVMLLSKSEQALSSIITTLQEKGIKPLPIKTYTLKYLLFSVLMKCKLGKKVLLGIVKSLK